MYDITINKSKRQGVSRDTARPCSQRGGERAAGNEMRG